MGLSLGLSFLLLFSLSAYGGVELKYKTESEAATSETVFRISDDRLWVKTQMNSSSGAILETIQMYDRNLNTLISVLPKSKIYIRYSAKGVENRSASSFRVGRKITKPRVCTEVEQTEAAETVSSTCLTPIESLQISEKQYLTFKAYLRALKEQVRASPLSGFTKIYPPMDWGIEASRVLEKASVLISQMRYKAGKRYDHTELISSKWVEISDRLFKVPKSYRVAPDLKESLTELKAANVKLKGTLKYLKDL